MSDNTLTPEQNQELEAIVKIAHVLAVHRRWSHEEFSPKLSFVLQCLFGYWGVEKEQLPGLMARVNEIALEQKEEFVQNFGRRLQA